MRTRLSFVLMAVLMALPTIAISFSFGTPQLRAEVRPEAAGNLMIVPAQENGRKVYVNDAVPAKAERQQPEPVAPAKTIIYWSVTEHRWKPVPASNQRTMRAARSAASEVRLVLRRKSSFGGDANYAPVGNDFVSSEQINSAIEEAAARHNVDPNLVRAVIKVESNFNPHAVSRKGALGLMQLMPFTARELKVTNPFDPHQNVDAGVRHLKQLLNNFGGDVNLTLAAYNAGSGAVLRSGGVPHYAETQNYVKRITNLYSGSTGTGRWKLDVPSRNPVRVFRDGQGVLTMTNTE
jgi:soluble lytic murein transglycosylase-like protein